MATFYIQLKDRLLQISGELTAENISKALGYVPVSPNVTNELSQRVDNITFDSLKDNPFLQDGSGELNIVDEQGNVIAKVDSNGLHSIDFIAGEHKLTDKIDATALDGLAKETWVTEYVTKTVTEGKVDLTGYATEEYVDNKDFYDIKNNPIINGEEGNLIFVDESGNIGLKLDKDNNLTVKDVIAGDHILSNKVDKESGKGLSTEDFTTALKTKLQSLSNYDDTTITNAINTLREDFDTLVSGDTTTAIKTFNEIIAFLNGVEDTESLEGIISSIEQQIANIEIPSLDGYATESWVNDKNYLTQHQDISHLATKTEVNNSINDIEFFSIKNNPIADTEDGNLIFVDETGNIGLKLDKDNNLTVADVVAGEHVLSNKADKSDLEGLATESYVITKVAEAKLEGSDITIPVQDVKVNGQTVIKDMVADIDLTPYAKTEDIPSLDGYVQSSELPNFDEFAKSSDIPSVEGLATEQWVTDKNYLTEHQDISHLASTDYVDEQIANVDVTEQLKDYALKSELPVNVSELNNDKGYLTQHQDISHLATKEELDTKDFYEIHNNPIVNDGDGKLVFVDESGNIGLQLEADNTLYVKDVVAGDDVLSNKMDITDNLVRIEDADGELDEVPEDVCVKYVTQSLTEEQKEQVRENIDAVSPNEFKTFNGESLIGTGDIELNLDSVINYDLNVKAVNHRGYSYEAPENTIPAYILSKKKGFTYVEGDVAFTKDGVAVLLHDATIDRTSDGKGDLSTFNYQELLQYDFGSWFSKEYAGVKIPTFTEWIVLCKNLGLHPYIELKSAGNYTQAQITQIVNEVTRCGMKGKVTYISFNATFLGYVKSADPSARLGYLCNPKGGFTSTHINTCKNLKTTTNEVFLDARHMEGYLDVTESKVDLCIAAGLPLEIWSVNSEDVILNMPKYISGVTSDYLIAGKVLYNNSLKYVPPVSSWVPTTSISLNQTLLSFINKEPLTLVATLEPSNASDPVVWKSSNTSIATVNNGVVTPLSDGNCNITATSDDKVANCSVVVNFAKYTITNSLIGCTLDNNVNMVTIGDSYVSNIIPNDGYSLKNSTISINMGGVDITSTAYNNGIITIPNVSGDINITIACVEVPVYSINRNLVGCTSNNNMTTIGEGNPYNETFTAIDEYDLNRGTVIITMGGIDITSNYSNGSLHIVEVTGDIVIDIKAYKLAVYSITRNLVGCISDSNISSILEGSSHTETITPETGYLLSNNANISINMGDIDITSNFSNNTLNITNVSGDIVINIEAVEIPVAEPANWEVVRTLSTDDILYGVGSNGSNNKVSSTNIPYTQDLATRMGYYVPDIPVEYGYRYKIEFVSVKSTAQVGVQCINQNWVNAYNSFSVNSTSPTSVSSELWDSTWQHSGYEFDLLESYNNSPLKFMRLTFRNSGSNPNVSNGDIVSVTISRRPVDVGSIVDLDMNSIVDNKLVNKGLGGSTYDATLNKKSTSDTYSIVDGALQLKNHAYASVNYGFNSSTPFTIVVKAKINTKSSKTYQRVMRTDVDTPCLYYNKNLGCFAAKLAGVTLNGAVAHNALASWKNNGGTDLNSTIIDLSNSNNVDETANIQEYKWISDASTIKFYYNGILLSEQNADALVASTSVGLGDNNTESDYYATLITVSEFKIYNQALSV